MDKKTEALKLALEALEWINRVNAMEYEYQQKARESLNAIYEALAEQPAQQQEPVARCMEHGECFGGECIYTSPPASKPWVGLTEEDIEAAMPGGIYDCLADPWDCNVGDGDYMRSIKKDVLRVARAAIAAYEAKNGITGEKA